MQKNVFRCFATASTNRSAEYEKVRLVDTFDRHRFKSQKFHAPYENLSLHSVPEASPLDAVLFYVDYAYVYILFRKRFSFFPLAVKSETNDKTCLS